jgi:hypothetical protein
MVERGEVVVLVLDLGTLDDREAETDADVLHAPADLRDEMQMSDRHRRVARERDVQAVLDQPAIELRGRQLRRPLLEQPLERLAHLVGLLAHRPALLGRQLADRAQRLGQLRLAAEVANPQLLQLGGRSGSAHGGLGLGAQLGQVSHEGRS